MENETKTSMEEFYENQPSFYDLAEADGTLIYHQIDSNGNAITEEGY